MSAHTKLILLTVFCVFLGLSLGQTEKCEECMADNEAYCVDKSSYYLCMGGNAIKSDLMKCPEGQVCTKSLKICEPEDETNTPICNSACNTCPTSGGKYTCVSQTQFGRCIDNKVTVISSCESGSICSTDLITKGIQQICAPTCVLDFLGISATCSNDKPITTTVAPPTTPNVETLKDKCLAKTTADKVYYVLADNTCKNYIYCEKNGESVEAVLMKCSDGFFNVEKKECVKVKPETCQ